MKDLKYLISKLESISDPNKNRVEMVRDRVGNWRIIIDECFTDLYVDGRDKVLEVAIDEVLQKYYKEKGYKYEN